MRFPCLFMRRPLFSALALLAFFVLTAVAAHAQAAHAQEARDTAFFDLRGAIARSLEASPEVGQREAQRQFAEARRAEARASRFLTDFNATTAHSIAPDLDIPEGNTFDNEDLYLNPDVDNDWENVRPFNRLEVEALQPIWTWGELGGSIRAARAGVDVEAAEVAGQELEVAFRTGELYYNVLLAESLFRLTGEAGNTVARARREVERLLEEGDAGVDDADLFQVQITEQEYQSRVAEVTQSRALARSALARQLFLPEGTAARPDTSLLRPLSFQFDSLAAYTELALLHRPELAQAEAGLTARSALVDVARSDYYPKLFLGASATYAYAAGRERQESAFVGDPFLSNSTRIGLGLRQQLNFFQTRAQVDQAEAELSEVRFQQEAAQQLIRFEVEQAFRDLRTAEAALAARDSSLQLSKEWLLIEQINFDYDLGNTENLIDAVRANLELQAAYYEAVRNYNVAVLRLLRTTGLLNTPEKAGMLIDFP